MCSQEERPQQAAVLPSCRRLGITSAPPAVREEAVPLKPPRPWYLVLAAHRGLSGSPGRPHQARLQFSWWPRACSLGSPTSQHHRPHRVPCSHPGRSAKSPAVQVGLLTGADSGSNLSFPSPDAGHVHSSLVTSTAFVAISSLFPSSQQRFSAKSRGRHHGFNALLSSQSCSNNADSTARGLKGVPRGRHWLGCSQRLSECLGSSPASYMGDPDPLPGPETFGK